MRTSLKSANLICILLINSVLLLLPFTSHARDIEITPFIGQMFSADLINSQNGTDLVVTDDKNYGLAIAWQDSPNGQGQILLNTVSHDFISSSDQQEHSFDITYLHFSGVTQLKQQNYVTTISLGIGATYFETDSKDEIYPSLTMAFGTRYELSKNIALVTELRGYASYIEEDNQLFCQETICHALLEDGLWLDGSISVGLAIKF
ncbi:MULTISPECIES: hypothetical protein [unclassified Colwellia]|jgi:hypothetical protein|uniref:hypothetical protein n=1 Tax=unclassified Colwellia TaxID=196834 RepID=UPI0015F3A614|nr:MULTISPECIES: hypothetical protein [unclassified Colwellia]MBA6365374.1 hypothetical protein [Colwellia sp. BRX8-8]MBA6337002.1 hypothetical protein [Colwellia sp. BRX8-7]MBA6370940.1 hypothetical protein [Colwellia sp. BRX8-4]MBA6379409.1 hypothetical protein [Colwellia sp. BRX10-7]MBA6385668.1 hypothetical protein [Colwellia sp. BRX10-2]